MKKNKILTVLLTVIVIFGIMPICYSQTKGVKVDVSNLSSKEKKVFNKIVEVFEKSNELVEQWTEEAMKVSSSEEAIKLIKKYQEIQKNMEIELSQISDSPENSELDIELEDEDAPLAIAIQKYVETKMSNPEYMQLITKTMEVYMGLLTKYSENPEIQKLMIEIEQDENQE